MSRFCLLICILLLPLTAFAGITHALGKWAPEKCVPTVSVQEHYDQGYQALYDNNWDEALNNFLVIHYYFADSPFYCDSLFYSVIRSQ